MHLQAGRVLISESSYEFLKESNYFYTELRDTIKVKVRLKTTFFRFKNLI